MLRRCRSPWQRLTLPAALAGFEQRVRGGQCCAPFVEDCLDALACEACPVRGGKDLVIGLGDAAQSRCSALVGTPLGGLVELRDVIG